MLLLSLRLCEYKQSKPVFLSASDSTHILRHSSQIRYAFEAKFVAAYKKQY